MEHLNSNVTKVVQFKGQSIFFFFFSGLRPPHWHAQSRVSNMVICNGSQWWKCVVVINSQFQQKRSASHTKMTQINRLNWQVIDTSSVTPSASDRLFFLGHGCFFKKNSPLIHSCLHFFLQLLRVSTYYFRHCLFQVLSWPQVDSETYTDLNVR